METLNDMYKGTALDILKTQEAAQNMEQSKTITSHCSLSLVNRYIQEDPNHDKVQVIEDTFVDCAGREHKFMIAAVSIPVHDGYADIEDTDFIDITKMLSLGISVCNPADKYSTKIAYLQATGRARKRNDRILLVNRPGLINTDMVQALLEQEAKFLKNNPDCLIKGYSDFERRWKKRQITLDI